MEYEGYLTKDEVLVRVEKAFPFMEKPPEDELYVFDESDLLRRIINSGISRFVGPELPYEGVMVIYDEFSTISQKAVKWMLPSMLRTIIKDKDTSGNLHWHLPTYLENINLDNSKSAYNFSWLSKDQLSALNCVLEYISEKYGDSTGLAQARLRDLEQRI